MSANPAAFIRAATPPAQAAMRRLGIPASVAIAQAALETGWGQSELAQRAKNYFGMSVGDPAWAATDPFWDGGTYGGTWRAYSSPAQSFLDFMWGFYRNPAYAPALAVRSNPSAFATAEAPIYAPPPENPGYTQNLLSILNDYDLSRFDLPTSALSLDPRIPAAYRAA